jgi:hypothetical protein
MKQESCKHRIEDYLQGRLNDIRQLWNAYLSGAEELEGLDSICQYGLGFDYVAPGTFDGQRCGYFRWQLSWGGPSDEFRFYTTEALDLERAEYWFLDYRYRKGCRFLPQFDRIEYWFLDWFDVAHKVLIGKDKQLLGEIFEWMRECGTVEHAFREATSQ